jgi:hypothetical protein
VSLFSFILWVSLITFGVLPITGVFYQSVMLDQIRRLRRGSEEYSHASSGDIILRWLYAPLMLEMWLIWHLNSDALIWIMNLANKVGWKHKEKRDE